MRTLALLFTLVATTACGSSSRPAATGPDPAPAPAPAPDEASCCCDYIKEEGDPESDTWSENQTYELMDPAGCTELSGTCVDASSCSA